LRRLESHDIGRGSSSLGLNYEVAVMHIASLPENAITYLVMTI